MIFFSFSAFSADCNGNGVDDGEDVTNAASEDCNADGVPDECQGSALTFGRAGSALLLAGSAEDALVADLDGDGDPDPVVARRASFWVYLNAEVDSETGFAGLADPIPYEVGSNMRAIAAADVDGDGAVDILVAASDLLFLYWGRGDGSLEEPQTIPLPDGVRDFTPFDVNQDGFLEVAIAHRDLHSALVLPNDGGRNLRPPVTLSEVGRDPQSIVSGDMDGDADPDLVTKNNRSFDIAILINNGGDLEFSSPVHLPFEGPIENVALGDLNGDGAADLVVTAEVVNVLLNHGDGQTFDRTIIQRETTGLHRLDVADIDGDGDVDILSNSIDDQFISVALNDGEGGFDAIEDFDLGFEIVAFEEGDFDGDGELDFVVVHENRSLAFLRQGQGTPLNFDSTTLPIFRAPHTGALGDLDGDGDLDFATGDGAGNSVSLLWNDGTGGFELAEPTAANNGSWVPVRLDTMALADFDGDGDNDMIVGGHGSRRLWFLENPGEREFAPDRRREIVGPETLFYLAAADLDGDGSPDLAGTSERKGLVVLLFNDGGGGFEQSVEITAGTSTRSLAIDDFDADGDLDIVASNALSQDLTLLTNTGDGNFELRLGSFSAGARPVFVVSGDWNEDGYPDLATANTLEQTVGVFLNRGDGSFAPPEFISILVTPYSMPRPADMNGDGFLDIIVTSEPGGKAAFALGDGRGGFPTGGQLDVGGGPRFSDVGDVDGDGDMDLVSANRGSEDVSVHLNRLDQDYLMPFAESICTFKDFEELAETSGGGLSVKFTLPARADGSLLSTVFQNSKLYSLHQEFLRAEFPELFPALTAQGLIGLTQLRASRDYFIGAVQRVRDPGGSGFLYPYSIVTAPGRNEVLTLDEVRWVDERLREALTLEPLAYAPDATGEAPLAREAVEGWVDPGFPIFLGTVITGSDYIPYTSGVGYGRVRLFDREEFDDANANGRLTFRDLAIIDHAPRDIEGLLGGVITAVPQGVLSHVAIRTARRGTPNAFVSQALGVFVPFDGQLVRLEVGPKEYTVREATLEEAEEFWAQRPSLPQLPPFDPVYSGLDRLEELDFSSGFPLESRFGGKASSLARLQTILTGPYGEYRELGFAIPMHHYLEFMQSNTRPSVVDPSRQVNYQEYLAELFELEEFQTDSEFRFEALDNFRDQARDDGVVSEELVQALAQRIEEVFGSTRVMVRFRSSSNVEDIIDFNGAGLYESTSVCAEDTLDPASPRSSHCDSMRSNERTIERALKKVWTSLWTFRAYEERWFFQIPQESATMGILVNRAFLDEAANGVAFTGDPTNPRGGCYLVTVQEGEESVVSPDPGVLAGVDLLEVADGAVVKIIRAQSSSLLPPGEVVLSDDKLEELGALMWHIDKNYPLDTEGRERQDILLDLEFKVEQDGSLAVKQVRPFLPGGESEIRPTFELEVPSGTVVCGGLNLVSPSGSPRSEYEAKSQVRFLAQTVELPSSHCVFTGELFEEVLVGPAAELAIAEGPGLFRVEDRPDPSGNRTRHTFSYRQLFSLPDGRGFELNLFNLEFASSGGTAVTPTLLLDGSYITETLTMLGFSTEPDVTFTYGSCDQALLPEWLVEAELADGTSLRLKERFSPPDDITLTGPASLQKAEVQIGERRYLVTSYWDLVYSAGRHNIGVVYWVVLESPLLLDGVARPIHVIELRAPDPPEVFGLAAVPQEAGAAYLDENLDVIAQVGVLSFEKNRVDDTERPFQRGDATADGSVNIADAISILGYLFLRGELPRCAKAADANDDGKLNVRDAIGTLRFALRGSPLPAPSPACGADPTQDELGCEDASECF